ncbi:hypothetical protein CDAR_106301 [Caerostris darwini]|uniref:Uncharacterized protein n=1 Tax=Caerostris darwini TaxID=1538125 RepID=A0AAV4SH75_9ARAC|nr:hypothetical protein CDAR_106301 [Caerostris darwini]
MPTHFFMRVGGSYLWDSVDISRLNNGSRRLSRKEKAPQSSTTQRYWICGQLYNSCASTTKRQKIYLYKRERIGNSISRAVSALWMEQCLHLVTGK